MTASPSGKNEILGLILPRIAPPREQRCGTELVFLEMTRRIEEEYNPFAKSGQ
jgi:hypothetical protein